MPRAKTAFVCTDCGAHSVKWQGQCPDCGAWNTLDKTSVSPASSERAGGNEFVSLENFVAEAEIRFNTGFEEFDRVLGGGVVPGSVVLLGGDPGVGKSTLLQQVGAGLPDELETCYATGEESLRQVAERSRRLQVPDASMRILADTSLDNVLRKGADARCKVLIIDSIQTMACNDVPSAPGSVTQLRESVSRVVQFAKQNEVAVFLIGHVTKEGAIAGPRVVEHMVDTVLYFESDPTSRYSIVRAVKNRFGASSEMGVFAMGEQGFREVRNPSAIFLSREHSENAGSVVSVAWEGSRPLLVEIQALVADANNNHARRLAQGIEQNRLALLLAALQRHGGISLAGEDVFINVVGGFKIADTSADFPSLLSIVSSFRDRECNEKLVCFGEIGLAGEVRPVRFGEERIAEAAKQGFTQAIVPAGNVPRRKFPRVEINGIRSLSEGLDLALG